MKLLNPFLINIQFIFFFLLLSHDARAENPSCAVPLHSLEGEVDAIHGQGGIWSQFGKSYQVRGHAKTTLTLDKMTMILIVSLKHLCTTLNGIPYDEIADVIIPLLKENGEDEFMGIMINYGHSPEQAEKLVEYARFTETNLNRKLDNSRVIKTIEETRPYIDRLVSLSKNMGELGSDKTLETAKTLIVDMEAFRTTNPYMIQADHEALQIPHARFITGDSDAM